MEQDFWQARWAEKKIAFHEGQANWYLTRHLEVLGPAPRRVLVPLAGKTEDLAFLAAAGYEVVAVELVEDAVKAFFAEHGLTPTVQADGPLVRYQAGGITFHAGDFFAFSTAPVEAFYDRAAMVALPPGLRSRYVSHLQGLLAPGARGLLVALEYPAGQLEGPPFSIDAGMVQDAWAGHAEVTPLERRQIETARGGVRVPGSFVTEAAYALQVHAPPGE
jgi:thiopurine S-methyltransferase